MSPGLCLSMAGHAGFVVWLIAGWSFASEVPSVGVTSVSLVSTAAFAALSGVETAEPVSATVERQEAVSATETQAAASAVDEAAPVVATTAAAPAPPIAAVSPASRQIAPTAPVAAQAVPSSTPPSPVVSSTAPVAAVDEAGELAATPGPSPIPQPPVTVQTALPVARSTLSASPSAPLDVVQALPDEPGVVVVETALRPPARPQNLRVDPAPEPEETVPASEPAAPSEPVVADAPPVPDPAPSQAAEGSTGGGAPAQSAEPSTLGDPTGVAVANYPGEVMQRLSRTRRDRISASGTAVIAFTVADNGALAALAVAQSSGVAEVDQAGLALVQRSAPFPAPPSGAERTFSFQFTGS